MIPVVAPAAVVAGQIAGARFRAGPSGFIVVSSDSAAGETIAPAAPRTTRAVIRMTGHCARPPAFGREGSAWQPVAEHGQAVAGVAFHCPVTTPGRWCERA